MSFQYPGPGGTLTAGRTRMVLVITNSSWVVISEMKLPSGCEEVEAVELLSSMGAGMGKWDNYGAKSGNCMRTVQVAVTLEQCEGEESQGQRQSRVSWDCCATLWCIQPTIEHVSVPFSRFTVCAEVSYQQQYKNGTLPLAKRLLTLPVSDWCINQYQIWIYIL